MWATEPAANIMTEDQARSHAEVLALPMGITFSPWQHRPAARLRI
jgi:hypothetical protein